MNDGTSAGRVDLGERAETVMVAYDDGEPGSDLNKEVARARWALVVFVAALFLTDCVLRAACGQ